MPVLRLKQHQMIQLADYIRTVCERVNGHAVYRDGWDDHRVQLEFAAQIGEQVSPSSVRSVRRDCVGDVREPRTPSNGDLAARIARLEEWAAARPVQPFKPAPEQPAGPLFGDNGRAHK